MMRACFVVSVTTHALTIQVCGVLAAACWCLLTHGSTRGSDHHMRFGGILAQNTNAVLADQL
jgi:hypothetical protein